jgi:lysozyme family protein
MLIQQRSGGNGFGYGFGAAGLIQGKDFNCNATICYGTASRGKGVIDDLFKKLQQNLNVLSNVGDFKPINVDGFIGKDTLSALAALKQIGFDASAYSTKEAVAQNAEILTGILRNLAVVQTTVAVATNQPSPLAPPGTPITYQPPQGAAAAAAITAQLPGASPLAAKLPKISSKTLWWIAGGLAVATVVGGVGYVVYRRKGR